MREIALFFFLAVAMSHSFAQTTNHPFIYASAAPLVYDIASIRVNKSGATSGTVRMTGDGYFGENVRLKTILADAYGIKEDRISGVSGQFASVRFNIQAKALEADPGAIKKLNPKQRSAMLIPILSKRFALKAHTETKILPVYELIVIRNSPRLKHSVGDTSQSGGMDIHNHRELTAHNFSMASFADVLAGQLKMPVIDKTGLAGDFDFSVKWSLQDDPDTTADAAPLIFTALQEELGLKLRRTKGPVETLIVDHVEMPSEN